MRRFALALLFALIAAPAVADTLVVVGVVVKKDGQRVAGAKVKLYPTAMQTGEPLADDTASDRGVFNLHRANITDPGELYVVYSGDGNAVPIKVELKSTAGVMEARTADLVVLPAAAKL